MFWPSDLPDRNPILGHRCYEHEVLGRISYDPSRPGLVSHLVAVIELEDAFAVNARARFESRHGITLDPPVYGFHMSIFRGSIDQCDSVERLWGHLDGEKSQVQLTNELFWKGRSVWANAYSPEYNLLRHTLAGLDTFDAETWGHATIGTFPQGCEFPRFLDYRDLDLWGFRP